MHVHLSVTRQDNMMPCWVSVHVNALTVALFLLQVALQHQHEAFMIL